jgi:hypothetical protein
LITSLLSKKKPLRSVLQKHTAGDITGNETGPEIMSGGFAPTQSHGQPVLGPLIDECEYGETVTQSLARMAELIHPYRDRTYSVKQRWTLLVAIIDLRVLPAKEAIVPQTVLTVRLRPSHLPLAQPLIFLLHGILKTHKETAAVGLRVRIVASQIRMELEMRSGHIAHVRHLPLKQRHMKIAAMLTHLKLCDGKQAPQITALLRSSLRLSYRTSLTLSNGHSPRQTSLLRRWCRVKSL